MRIQKGYGEVRYLELDSQEEMKCLELLGECIIEQLKSKNPRAGWAVDCVYDVIDEENGAIGFSQNYK